MVSDADASERPGLAVPKTDARGRPDSSISLRCDGADRALAFVDAGGHTSGLPDASHPGDGNKLGADASPLPNAEHARKYAKNVIFLMADGYGAEQINATRMFINGDTAPLSFEKLPHRALVTTHNARRSVTDSAAAATAMATGHKTDSYVVSVGIPGDGGDLPTALEIQKARGKCTGLVTTHTAITDASPAGFGGHAVSRFSPEEIANVFFTETRPNVLFGLVSAGITVPAAVSAGYDVVLNATELGELDLEHTEHVSGQFSETTIPPLKELALSALTILERSEAGFFLMVEHEGTDTSGHRSDLNGVLTAAVEFETMASAILSWAGQRDDTLVIVGADHETGGLVLDEPNPVMAEIPTHEYTSGGQHTGAKIAFFATGIGAEHLSGTMDNTELFPLFAGYSTLKCTKGSRCYRDASDLVLTTDGSPPGLIGSSLRVVAGAQSSQALLYFPDLEQHLPKDATLTAAKLIVHATNGSSTGFRVHRMLTPWSETGASLGDNGVQANNLEASRVADTECQSPVIGINTLDVTRSVKSWLNDPSANFGWVLIANGDDDVELGSTESALAPELRLYFE